MWKLHNHRYERAFNPQRRCCSLFALQGWWSTRKDYWGRFLSFLKPTEVSHYIQNHKREKQYYTSGIIHSHPQAKVCCCFFCFVFFPQWRLKPGGAFSWKVTIKWRKMSCFHTMSACWWSCIYYFLFSNFSRSLLIAISERFLVLSLCSIWRCVFCHRGTRAPGCCQRGFCEVCWCSPQHWEIRHSASKDHQTCKHRFNLCFESFIVLKVHTSVKNIHFKESFGKFCLCILYIVFLKSVRVKFIM